MLDMVNWLKLIFSEKDEYLSQYAGSNELEVPFKADRVSPASVGNQQRRPLHVNGSPNQRESRTRNKNRLVSRVILK